MCAQIFTDVHKPGFYEEFVVAKSIHKNDISKIAVAIAKESEERGSQTLN